MINTEMTFKGDKEIASIVFDDDRKPELRVYHNPSAKIGEKDKTFNFDDLPPILTLKFKKRSSVDSLIKQLENVRNNF